MNTLTTKTAKEWYRVFRALFAKLLGDPADKGALNRIVIYDPVKGKMFSLSEMQDAWLKMDNIARAEYLNAQLEKGCRLFLYKAGEDRPREVTPDKQGYPKLSKPLELIHPEAPKKPGLLSRMLDNDAASRFEEETALYQQELQLSKAAIAYAALRQNQYAADRAYLSDVYEPLIPEREIEADHDLCARKIDLMRETMLSGRERYTELFAPELPEDGMPAPRAAAIVMGELLSRKGMVLVNYLVGEETEEEEEKEILEAARQARTKAKEAFLYLQEGNKEYVTEMTRQSLKLGVGLWQGIRFFNSAAALTLGMFLSDLLECVEEDPEIEHCPLLERIDMVEARSAACVAKTYDTFVSTCDDLLRCEFEAGSGPRKILALRAMTCAAAIIDLNGAGRAAYQIFDPVAMEITTNKRRLFARGLDAVVTKYYPGMMTGLLTAEIAHADEKDISRKLMELSELKPSVLRQRPDLLPDQGIEPEQLRRRLIQQNAPERTL